MLAVINKIKTQPIHQSRTHLSLLSGSIPFAVRCSCEKLLLVKVISNTKKISIAVYWVEIIYTLLITYFFVLAAHIRVVLQITFTHIIRFRNHKSWPDFFKQIQYCLNVNVKSRLLHKNKQGQFIGINKQNKHKNHQHYVDYIVGVQLGHVDRAFELIFHGKSRENHRWKCANKSYLICLWDFITRLMAVVRILCVYGAGQEKWFLLCNLWETPKENALYMWKQFLKFVY